LVVLVSHHAAYHANPARKGGLIFCEGNNAIFLPATHSKQYNMDGWIPKDLLYTNRPVIHLYCHNRYHVMINSI